MCENGRFQSLISSAGMHVIKRLTVNYDTPRQYLNLTGQISDIRPRLALRDLQTLGVPPLANKFHLMRSRLAVLYGAYFLL